jgi:hypothetical protein
MFFDQHLVLFLNIELNFNLMTNDLDLHSIVVDLNSCPIEPRIPVYLIVLGSVNLISICFSIAACIIHNRKKDENIIGFYYVHCSAIIIIILQLFNFI